MDNRAYKLYEKCEAMSLLCGKATNHWSLVKFIFQIPLDDGKGDMKIANVVVNGVSVLLISYQSNLKVAEKCELFKNLSNQFLQLAHEIEGKEPDSLDRNSVNTLIEKYDSLVSTCLFEDIPKSIKMEVIKIFEGKSLPLQLNGASGLSIKRNSGNIVEMSSQIV
jgi:hypothetical protein